MGEIPQWNSKLTKMKTKSEVNASPMELPHLPTISRPGETGIKQHLWVKLARCQPSGQTTGQKAADFHVGNAVVPYALHAWACLIVRVM